MSDLPSFSVGEHRDENRQYFVKMSASTVYGEIGIAHVRKRLMQKRHKYIFTASSVRILRLGPGRLCVRIHARNHRCLSMQ